MTPNSLVLKQNLKILLLKSKRALRRFYNILYIAIFSMWMLNLLQYTNFTAPTKHRSLFRCRSGKSVIVKGEREISENGTRIKRAGRRGNEKKDERRQVTPKSEKKKEERRLHGRSVCFFQRQRGRLGGHQVFLRSQHGL